jgi:hypothetical protein
MTRLRWLGAAASAAAIAAGVWFGASGLAATHVAHTNYRGPARVAHQATVTHHSNYRGPARRPAGATVHGSNLPASATANRGAQR